MQTTYTRRLNRVRDALALGGLDALVVTHLPNVRYLTGFNGSAGLVILSAEACLLLVDFRYATAARDLLARRDDRDLTLEVASGSYDTALAAALVRDERKRIAIEAAWMPVSRFNRLSAALAGATPVPVDATSPGAALVPTERLVEASRVVKDAAEIATLREAGRRISGVGRRLGELARPGQTEQAVAAEIDAAIREAGFERPAFETIVASGPNSALPHARPTFRVLAEGEGVVLDFGGVYDGYCVDLTRTVRLGAPPAPLGRLFDAVKEAHAAAMAAVAPGVMPSEIDAAARTVLARHGLAEAFGHGTGHGLGLEIHEEPRIARQTDGQPEAPIERGMVFTIEPGAYVEGVGGVRIEDDVLVVENGCERLTDVPIEMVADPS